MNTGIIGLGLIGSVWANHLEADGLLKVCWNRTLKPNFSKSIKDIHEVAKLADVIHICVFDEASLKEVVTTILPGLSSRHLIVQSTTIDPTTSDYCKFAAEETGASYCEAPFTGSLTAAEKRQTVFMLGGDKQTLEKSIPYITHLSEKQFKFDTNRQACTFKLSMNLQIAAAAHALSQSLNVCRKEGIGDDIFFDAFKANASYTGVAAMKEQMLRSGDFSSPQFSVKNLAKDLRLYTEMRHEPENGLETQILKVLQSAISEGRGEEDFSSIVKSL